MPASSEFLFKLQPVKFIQPYQHLSRGRIYHFTIALLYPDFGELGFLFGEEGSGLDGLEGSRLVERLTTTQAAANSALGQALHQLELDE